MEIEKSMQERRNHLEQLHRQAAAEASHGAEATQLQILVPDGVTKHLPQEARDCLKKAADLYEEERKAEAAAKEAAARPAKEAMELGGFGDLDDREDTLPDPVAEARIDEILQAQIRGDPEIGSLAGADRVSARRFPRRTHQARVTPGEGEPPKSLLSRSMGTSGQRMQIGWRR